MGLGINGLHYVTVAMRPELYHQFMVIVRRQDVSISAYLRAMIVDVVNEELPLPQGDEPRTTAQ